MLSMNILTTHETPSLEHVARAQSNAHCIAGIREENVWASTYEIAARNMMLAAAAVNEEVSCD